MIRLVSPTPFQGPFNINVGCVRKYFFKDNHIRLLHIRFQDNATVSSTEKNWSWSACFLTAAVRVCSELKSLKTFRGIFLPLTTLKFPFSFSAMMPTLITTRLSLGRFEDSLAGWCCCYFVFLLKNPHLSFDFPAIYCCRVLVSRVSFDDWLGDSVTRPRCLFSLLSMADYHSGCKISHHHRYIFHHTSYRTLLRIQEPCSPSHFDAFWLPIAWYFR